MLCFVNKLTVIGIIGNTQGVNKAAKPPKNAKKKIDNNPFSSSFIGSETVAAFSIGATSVLVVSKAGVAVFVVSTIGVTTVSYTHLDVYKRQR